MKAIRIDFVDLESTLPKEDNIFYHTLSRFYKVNLDTKNPETIFYGDNGTSHLNYNCTKIYVSQENKMPNFRCCDYAFSYLNLKNPRNVRLPFYVYNCKPDLLVKQVEEAEQLLASKSKFCSFVASNPNIKRTRKRIEFFKKLSRYKKVDSGGDILNNIGYKVQNKSEFLKPYKFNIAFENRSYPGYTSEKITHSMQARCTPIYWGNPRINEDFNPKSFINVHDFKNDDEAIDYIVELDKNDTLYLKLLKEPFFYNNEVSAWYQESRLTEPLKKIFDTPTPKRNFFYTKHLWFNLRKSLEPYLYQIAVKSIV